MNSEMMRYFKTFIICLLMIGGSGMGVVKNLFGWMLPQARAEENISVIKPVPEELTAGLRKQAFSTKLSDLGNVEPVGEHGVYGVFMETGYEKSVVTLVTFMTGDASLYFSTGGGMIGGIGHETIKKAAIAFNKKASAFISSCMLTTDFPMPQKGQTIFYILTKDGVYTVEAKEDDLGNKISPLTYLFFAGQDVITEYRWVQDPASKEKEPSQEKTWYGEAGYVNCFLTMMAEGAVKSVVIDSEKPLPNLDAFSNGNEHLSSWIKSQRVYKEKLDALEVCRILLSSAGYDDAKPFQKPLYLNTLVISTDDHVSKEGVPILFKIESVGKGQGLVLQIAVVSKEE